MQNRGNRFGVSLARQTFQRFNRSRDGVSEAQFFASVERSTPVRPPALESDVLVPAAAALLIGVGTFTVVTPIAVALFTWWNWDLMMALAVGGVAGGIGFGVMALDAIIASRRSIYATDVLKDNLLAKTESSGEKEEVTSSTVELTVRREDVGPYPQILKREVPIDEERWREFALSAVNGNPITQSEWVGRDKLFSRSEFDKMMQYLMESGIVAWASSRDEAQGRALTRGGKASLQAWLKGKVVLGEQGARASTHASSVGVLEAGEAGLE